MIAARRSADRESLMIDLADTVASEFAGDFENIAAKLHKWVDPLSNEQFWRTRTPTETAPATCCCISMAISTTTSARKLQRLGTCATAIVNSRRHLAQPRKRSCETL